MAHIALTHRARLTSALIGLATGLLVVLAPLRATGQDSPRSKSTVVVFHEMTFELPGSGWSRQETDQQINLTHSNQRGQSQGLAVWAVLFPGSLANRTPQEHATAIFDFERHQARPGGTRWEGFIEGTRTISASPYPVMTFSIHLAGGDAEGVFLLYFPPDFQQRQRFYCFMFQETRRTETGSPKLDLSMLDNIVSSFRVGSVAPPPPPRLRAVKAGEGLLAPTYRSQIERLLTLSQTTASSQTESSVELKRLAVRFAEQLEKQPSFSSHVQLVDRSVAALDAHNYVTTSWTFDHQAPNRYHVTQSGWNGKAYDYDEWITIGQTHFDFAGFWFPPPNSPRIDLNSKLGLPKYLQVLRSEEPRSGGTQSFDGKSYASMTYLLSSQVDFKGFLGSSDGSVQVELWIESESGLLAKARVIPTEGTPVREFQQVFVGYGGNVQIQAPSQVLTPK